MNLHRFGAVALLVLTLTAGRVKAADSRIDAVTLYEQTALVTRLVEVSAEQGNVELVVGPLPTSLQPGSLYAESDGELRVLSTRYRQRVQEDATDEEVQQLLAELQETTRQLARNQAAQQAVQSNLQLLDKMEAFTQSAVQADAADGAMNAESIVQLATHIAERRSALLEERVTLEQAREDLTKQFSLTQARVGQVEAKADRTVREAIITIDNPAGAAGTVRLGYVVNAAGWTPQYRIRAATGDAAVTLESLASVFQQTGEDWSSVELTLSTATPNLNAAPPELLAVQLTFDAVAADSAGGGGFAGGVNLGVDGLNELRQQQQAAQGQYGKALQSDERERFNLDNNLFASQSAAADLLADRGVLEEVGAIAGRELKRGQPAGDSREQAVTFTLAGRTSIAWRDDEQLLEIDSLALDSELGYQAVPQLTASVYRTAALKNTGDRVLLAGPAKMYLDDAFVGRTDLPMVAVGQDFSVGLGVDPQLTAVRRLVDRTNETLGGNQVRTPTYEIAIRSLKGDAVTVQVLDRMPKDEGNAVRVELVSAEPALSEDADYQKLERPSGILRWDLPVPAGETATIEYAYSVSFDRQRQPTGVRPVQGQ